jgi:perosamine synthetase
MTMIGRKLSLAEPILDKELKEVAMEALENDRYTKGENVLKFEEEFARYVGVKCAVSTNSGTAALHVAFLALGLKPGDEVITTPLSFVATANSVIHARGVPKFADISFEDYNIDPALVEKALSERTKGLLPVHLFGHPADTDALQEICSSRGLVLVEDACQAHGAKLRGRGAGALGDVGCFSFYPSKNLWVPGDGGMATTNDEDLARMMAKLADCGRVSHYEHDLIGYTYRLSSVNAAVGRILLQRMDKWNARRREFAERYHDLLGDLDAFRLPPKGDSEIQPVYHQFVLLVEDRDRLKEWLEKRGIQCGIHYPIPIHLQPVYKKLYGYQGGEYPLSEEFSRKCLSIPIHPFLDDDDIKRISEDIKAFYNK